MPFSPLIVIMISLSFVIQGLFKGALLPDSSYVKQAQSSNIQPNVDSKEL